MGVWASRHGLDPQTGVSGVPKQGSPKGVPVGFPWGSRGVIVEKSWETGQTGQTPYL